MRAFALVLLVATSAFAAPNVVSISQANINEINRLPDDGRRVNSAVIDSAWETIDAADNNIYTIALQQIMTDMGNAADKRTQAIAVAQTLAVAGSLANGIAGDSCVAASAINNYAAGGSAAAFRAILAQLVDNLAEVAVNPLSRRFATAPAAGCVGGGRVYNLEAAWDRILGGVSANSAALLNEEYCAVKRLYDANHKFSNNAAAGATAAAAVADEGYDHEVVADFLRAIAYNGNVPATAAHAKAALLA